MLAAYRLVNMSEMSERAAKIGVSGAAKWLRSNALVGTPKQPEFDLRRTHCTEG